MSHYDILLAKKLSGGGGGSGTSILPQIIDRSVTEITAEDLKGVTKIGEHAFSFCKYLSKISLPDSVTLIDEYAFESCSTPYGGLSEITIPNSVTSIYAGAFNACTKLEKVILGNSVRFIGERCFASCGSLLSITSLSINPPTLSNHAFSSVPDGFTIYVPAESVDAYKEATNWSYYVNYIQAIPE